MLYIRRVGAEEPGEFCADDAGADGAEAGFRQRAHKAVLLRAVDVARLVQPSCEEAYKAVQAEKMRVVMWPCLRRCISGSRRFC